MTKAAALSAFFAAALPCVPAAAQDGGVAAATVAVQAVQPMADGRARVAECSGVLIEPDLVLTAGHCLDGVDRPAHVGVFVYAGGKPKPPHVAVVLFARHPGHVVGWQARTSDPTTRQSEISADLALLRLAAPQAGRSMTLAADPYDRAAGSSTLGGTGRTGAAGPGGALKSVALSSVRLSTGTGARVAFASAGSAICHGDSGGPIASGGRVWGVVSAVLKAKGGCGSRLVATPVDPASEGFRRMRADLGGR